MRAERAFVMCGVRVALDVPCGTSLHVQGDTWTRSRGRTVTMVDGTLCL